jgi:hypothetical protein
MLFYHSYANAGRTVAQLSTMGNLTPLQHPSYAVRTSEVELCAAYFFEDFFAIEQHYMDYLEARTKAAAVITFATVICGTNKMCLVAISGASDSGIERNRFGHDLYHFIASKTNKPCGYTYNYIAVRNLNFDALIANTLDSLQLPQAKNWDKHCSEKKIGSMIEKLFHIYGDDMRIEGMISVSLSRMHLSQPRHINKPLEFNMIGNRAWFGVKEPCDCCMANKPAIYRIWEEAKRYKPAPASPVEDSSLQFSMQKKQ